MAFHPTPAGVARIRYTWDIDQAVAQNVLYVDTGKGAPLTSGECDALITIAAGAFTEDGGGPNALLPVISDTAHVLSISAEEASVNDGAFAQQGVDIQGGYSGPACPPGVAAVTTWKTGMRGRDRRGRTFWPGVPEASTQSSGEFNTGDYEAWAAGVNGFRVAFEAGGGTFPDMVGLVVASFFHQVVPGTPPTVPRAVAQITPITGGLMRHYCHSQRRRNHAG